MKKRTLFFLAALLCTIGTLLAQKAPLKYGKVSMEELQMTSYAPDTSAAAVVLYHYGYFNGTEFKFYLTRRLKVLKKVGTDMLDFVFDASGDATVKAKVFNLVDGQVVEEKINSDDIFKERIYGDNYQYRIAFPNVKVGSVIDIETSHFSLPSEFYFQDMNMPVKHAEIVLEENTYIEYRKRASGYGDIPMAGSNRYMMQDLPAFKNEPYLNSPLNYMPKFEFDILRVSFPGFYKSYSTSWEAVNKLLTESDNFGGVLKSSSGYLSELSDSINATCKTPLEKAQAGYEAIKRVKWNKSSRLYSSSNMIGTVYKKGIGNSADINILLYLLLKRLDLNTWPVVLSTRSNGTLNLYAPTLYKLNNTILAVTIDEKTYMLDASEKFAPFGLLPVRCLNSQGRLVNDESGSWVDLKTDKAAKEMHSFTLEMTPELKFKGEYVSQKTDYAALNFRTNMSKYASQEKYITDMEGKYPGLIVKNYKYEMIDSIYQPSLEKYEVEISNKAEKINDMVMINPFMTEQMTQNPFKTDKRKFPVDFAYGQDKIVNIKFKIPDGYMVSELPKGLKVAMPDNSAIASIRMQAVNNEVTVMYRLQIKKAVYTPEEYTFLQELYNQIIKKQAESIILKPVTNAASL